MNRQFSVGAIVSLTRDGAEHFKREGHLHCIQQLAFYIEEVLPDGSVVLQKANELPRGIKARTVPPALIQHFKGK